VIEPLERGAGWCWVTHSGRASALIFAPLRAPPHDPHATRASGGPKRAAAASDGGLKRALRGLIQALSGLTVRVAQLTDQVEALKKARKD